MTPSIRTSILRMVAAAFPALTFGHPRTYRVAAVRGDQRLDLIPPQDAAHLPELDAVEQWGLGVVTPVVGTEVVVMFRDANPSRPIVIGWEHAAEHDRIRFLEDSETVVDPTGRFVRYGDAISVPVAGPVATGTVAAGAPPAPYSKVSG